MSERLIVGIFPSGNQPVPFGKIARRRRLFKDNPPPPGEPPALAHSAGTIRYSVADPLGSIVALVDPAGVVTITGETSDNPFQYTGRGFTITGNTARRRGGL